MHTSDFAIRDNEHNYASLLANQPWSPDTILSFPGSTEFPNATYRWNNRNAPTYAAAISVGSEEDVIRAVKLATAHNISFLATGGRHGFGATLGRLQDGLALDLSPLDFVVIDSSKDTLTVGPGVRLRDIFDPVYEAGYQMQTGICTCVGMIGATIGAGIGRLQGTHGLMIDALLSVKLVTAAGELIEVSKDSYPDLFWGVRGASHNFGIITEATYQLQPLGYDFVSVDMRFPAALNGSFFEALAVFELGSEWAIAARIVYDGVAGEPAIVANAAYYGPQTEAEVLAQLHPFLDLTPPVLNIGVVPWNSINSVASFGSDAGVCAPGKDSSTYPASLRTRTASGWIEVFELMSGLYAMIPEARGSGVLFEAWANEAVRDVSDSETAYAWRETETYVVPRVETTPNASTSARAQSQELGRQIRKTLFATSGYERGAVYVNYALGDETLEQIYGVEKLPRLAKLKRKYDPDNVFGFHHPIPTAYP
ncbi:FAD-binding oxidoreductase [Aspergillus stella-maris]|uniref:FAD-binding oxidoreductase n=1 Tax=Aspergillus stella-maris TaxID=1810926 RepID=UPI003CCD561C